MAILITDIEQATLEEFVAREEPHFDLAIAAFGADSRSTHLINNLRNRADKILIGCDLPNLHESELLPQQKKRHTYKVKKFSDICEEMLGNAELARNSGKFELRVLVDVSCMSRVNMGQIFAQIKEACRVLPIYLSVGYCLARYIRPPDVQFPLIRRVAPVNAEYSGWGAPLSIPVDAIVSLGYEKGKAIGAVEYLEPRNRWVFVPHSPEERFLQQVLKHNNLLIKSAAGTTIDYEVLRPADTYFQLLSLISGLVQESRPVLLPFGPKIFFAICLLVAMRIEKASVWHVDGDDESPDASPQASGHSVLMSSQIRFVEK